MRKLIFSLAMSALLAAPLVATASTGDAGYRYLDRPFLEFLGYLEGPDGYDDITGFARRDPVKPVSRMTIAEVLNYQRMLRQAGSKSSAVGRYQFIYKTLRYLTNLHGIDRRQLFDKRMQDRLARLEMARCGFYDHSLSAQRVGNCLAQSWAALPVLTGRNRGKSFYADDGLNAARTTPEVLEAILRSRAVAVAPEGRRAGFTVTRGYFYGAGSTPMMARGAGGE